MLGWHRQLARISNSRERLANFPGSEEKGKQRTAVIYSLTHLFFFSFTALIRITKCKLFIGCYWRALLVHCYVKAKLPTPSPNPVWNQKAACIPRKPQFEKWMSLHDQRGHLLHGTVVTCRRPSLPRAHQAALPIKPSFFCWCSHQRGGATHAEGPSWR